MQMQIRQIPKQKLILIIGIALGLAAVIMTKVYIDQQKKAEAEKAKETFAKMQANQAAVLVAKRDIAKGVVIDPECLIPQWSRLNTCSRRQLLRWTGFPIWSP